MKAFLIIVLLALDGCATPAPSVLLSHTRNGETDIYVYYTSNDRYVAYVFKRGELVKTTRVDKP